MRLTFISFLIRGWFVMWCAVIPVAVWSQSTLLDMDHEMHRVLDRMQLIGGSAYSLHSSVRPFWRSDAVSMADSFYVTTSSKTGLAQVQWIWDQNNEFVMPTHADSVWWPNDPRYRYSDRPLWKTFYTTPAQFYEVDVPDFYLRINPILHIAAGRESEESVTTFYNQRGIDIRGGIGQHVYFQTRFYDSQVRYANYLNRYTDSLGVVPGVGLYKIFDSALFNSVDGRDFLLADGMAGVRMGKYFDLQLGHTQSFIGDGIRSLLLSDFSTPFFALKINTRIWRFQYQNIFAELAADNFAAALFTVEPIPKKYMAAHYLSFRVSRHFSLGLFEAVVFNRPGHRFELQYLNPVILYRTIEGTIGSPDNVLLGLNARLNVRQRMSLYGQFILDDIAVSQILDGHMDWWGNKFGYQIGGKYVDAFGVDQLDLQAEWNQVRPYTYSHYDENANYSHYKQPLAHPLGANFSELILSASWSPAAKLTFHGRLYLMMTGEDVDSVSLGSNVILPNVTRPGDYGHQIGQGVGTDILFCQFLAQYRVAPDLFADIVIYSRSKTSEIASRNLNTRSVQLGLRYHFPWRQDVF